MAYLVCLVVLLSLFSYSSANYCMCKDGVSDQALQKAIDYACGAGADCSPILSTGACYQPNTVKNHCDFAVNSYFQKKGQVSGSCDFAGAASPSVTAPAASTGTCVYPASPSTGGTAPSTTTPSTTTPSTTTPSTTTPSTTTPSTTTPSTTTPSTTTPSTTTNPTTSTSPTTTSTTPTVFGSGISPSGTGLDGSGAVAHTQLTSLFFCSLALYISGCCFLLWA